MSLLLNVGDPSLEALLQILLVHPFSQNDEDSIVACKGAKDLGDGQDIQGNANRVGVTGSGLDDPEISTEFDGEDATTYILDIALLRFAYQVAVWKAVV